MVSNKSDFQSSPPPPSSSSSSNGSTIKKSSVKNGNSIIHFDSIEEALKDFAEGKFVLVVDNEERENEGDLIIAAEKVTAEKMAFMIKYTSGLICVPTSPERLDQLEIPLMVPNNNTEKLKTAYTISVDYKHNTTTGISAHDRALTARCLANPVITNPNDFNRPGHIFPLRYTPGGVLKRIGHTEASIDLCKLARLQPVGVICELVKDDGSMARRDDCRLFADEHDLKLITIDDLIKYLISNTVIDDNDEGLTKTELKAQIGKTWGRDKDITYITVLCSAIIIICCPILVSLFWTICTHYQCSFYEPFHLFVMIEFSKESFNDYFLQKLPSFSWEGLQIYFGWLIFQGLLYAFLPAKIGYGQQTPAGHILPYKVNGLLAWVFPYILCLHQSISHPEDRKFSGSFIYDLLMGIEMNLRFGKYWDFKLFHNGKAGIIAWTLINLSFPAAQYNKIGYVTNSMILLNFLHLAYVLDFFYNEDWYLGTIVRNPVDLPWVNFFVILSIGLTGYYIFRAVNHQKDIVRKTNGNCKVWGKPAKVIKTQYLTSDGKIHSSLLLVSGYWGKY
nr:14581_t:CDS:10 [Entrophospora candida]